ncbi:MAG: nucleoside triphosphate pyrophosphohydrolase [Sphingomonas sp.]|nr:MAG: nucleoside triphosphate pyrophosphohydrolase [Sphingomonas sp.]
MTMTNREQALAAIGRLADIMDRLRGPGGCEWDRAQTFATIAPYTLEEAHEVADAIDRDDMPDLCEELGDLLLQVVFHARMADEAGHFTLADVADGICAKMERRHPHIFGPQSGPASADEVRATWEDIKAAEKPRESMLDGVALALPALTRAEKLASRAARKGFDWPDASGPLAKIHEELAEIASASTDAERADEAGDLLFAAANYARKLGVDPETALRGANSKFERRFRKIEKVAGFEQMSLEDQEALWQSAKRLP